MPAYLHPLYDKIRRLRQLQRTGLPFTMVTLTFEEQRQMCLLPTIILEPE